MNKINSLGLEIVLESRDYKIIKRTLFNLPNIERLEHETWGIAYYIKEESTQLEKQIDLHVTEGNSPLTQFKWIGPGIVEWSRDWIKGIIKSPLLGVRPERELRIIRFDFNDESSSSIVFHSPENFSTNGFQYQILDIAYYFDFNIQKLFIWHCKDKVL